MNLRIGIIAVGVLIYWAPATGAQESINLEFKDGYVWLIARDAPIRAILREWARVGDALIVNADGVEGERVTLELSGVAERVALDVVLRDVAGYILAPRASGSSGASVFDRVLILPTSSAPPPAEVARVGNPDDQPRASGRRPNRADEANLPEPLAAILRTGITGFTWPPDRPADAEFPAEDGDLPEPLAAAIRSGLTGSREASVQPRSVDADGEFTAAEESPPLRSPD